MKFLALLALIPQLALAGITSDQGLPSPPTVNPWRVTIVAPPGSSTSTVLTTNPSNPAQAGVVTRLIFPVEHLSAFGELQTTSKVPIVSLDFNYAINSFFTNTTTANGGTATTSGSMAVLQTSAAANGSVKVESRTAVRYIAGTGVFASFTGKFTTCTAGSQQEIGLGDDTDGTFIGCQGAVFGSFLRKGGVDTFTPRTSWSVDHLDGTGASGYSISPTSLELYKVEFGWHGSGPVKYYAFDVVAGRWLLAHVIGVPVASPRMLNPNFPLHLKAFNTSNTTNITLNSASMGGYRESGPSPAQDASIDGGNGSETATKAVTTEAAVLTIQDMPTVFSDQVNKVRIKLTHVTLSNTTAGAAVAFRGILNTTLGGSPSFVAFDATTSVEATDKSGTTVTGGRDMFDLTTVSGGSGVPFSTVDLTPFNIILNPSDTFTWTASTGGGAQTVNVACEWIELFSG